MCYVNMLYDLPSSTFTSSFLNRGIAATSFKKYVNTINSSLHRGCHLALHMTVVWMSKIHFHFVQASPSEVLRMLCNDQLHYLLGKYKVILFINSI